MLETSCVVLFTKPAEAGRVKTRLIGPLTAEQAAQLHAAFVGDLSERLSGGEFELVVAWALEPEERPPRDLLPVELPGLRQEGADLGARLYHALRELGRRYPWVLAVGSDYPELGIEVVERAFARLEAGAEVVFGPADDGGYYLVGVRAERLTDRLFEAVPWSGPQVLGVSLERCRELGLRYELLEPGSDVDTPEDLERLAARLAASRVQCPRTTRLLEEWGRSVR